MDFIQTDRGQFVYQGKRIRLRGFGIGTWLSLEHFMIGLPASEKIIRSAFQDAFGQETAVRFFNTYQNTFLQEGDFKLLKSCGVNFIRIPFNYRLFTDDNNPDTFLEEGFAVFDKLFALCAQYKIFALIDLHAAAGSQNPDWHSDNSNGVPLFWEYRVFRSQTVKLWGAIAGRYRGEPYLMGYDLLNEPAMASWRALNEFYSEAIETIRRADKNHIIVLEGDCFSMDFSGLTPFDDDKLAVGFHYYPTVWNPGLLDPSLDRRVRKEKIAEGLDRILNETKRFGWPVLCGEFGYAAKDCGSGAMQLLEDTLVLLESRQLDWLLWCYKDIGYMGMTAPCAASTWLRLAGDISPEWNQHIEKAQAASLMDMTADNWFPAISEDERYKLQFRLRACLYALQSRHILYPQLKKFKQAEILGMASEFAIENCRIDTEIRLLLTRFLLPDTPGGAA
ncbi:MAG: glycoside hydrolase family 5 protein [Treponema sp.]|jgi:hypothetical protein|nr:glycoside hydrolase family 5 protein [Treponema sp.]